MRVDSKILSIPPFISTDWAQVRAIYMKDDRLCISLMSSESIDIPNLSKEALENIFLAHSQFMEDYYKSQGTQQQHEFQPQSLGTMFQAMGLGNAPSSAAPFQMSIGMGESWNNVMQHNPEQSNIPDLPKEVVDKISGLIKAILPEDLSNMAIAEPHCNCMHCQVSRKLNPLGDRIDFDDALSTEEEVVSEDDLKFSEWEVKQTADNVFAVVNKLDNHEIYNVCLEPMGCTCGKKDCEHIIAVLKS